MSNISITKISKINGYEYPKYSEFKEYENVFFIKDYDNGKSIFLGNNIGPYIINHSISYWSMVVENYVVYYPEKGDLTVLDLRARSQKIIKIGGILNLYNDKEVIWFFDKFGLGRIDKSTYEIEKTNISFSIVRSFLTNDEYIWIGIDDGFVQLSKSYLATVLKPKEQVLRNEEMIETKRKELMREKDPIKFANGFFEMEKITNSKKIMNKLKSRLQYIFVIRDSSEIKRFEDYLEKGNDLKISEALCYGVICGYSLNGNPQRALEYYSRLQNINNKSIFLEYVSDRDLAKLNKAKVELESLKLINITEAERLFHLGKIYFEMFKLSWNYLKVGINTEFPFKYYMEVLDKYPESEWADNAEYEMLIYHQMCSMEGGYTGSNLRYIEKYNDFLKKYTETDLVSLVKCNISSPRKFHKKLEYPPSLYK